MTNPLIKSPPMMWLLSDDEDWEAIAWAVHGRLVNHEEVAGDVWTELVIPLDEDRSPLSACKNDIVVLHASGEIEVYERKDPPAYKAWLVAEELRLQAEAFGDG